MAFIFISPHQHRENHRKRFYDEFVCTLHTVKNKNKNLFDGQRGFPFTYERNCYLQSVNWESILLTFVGIVVSAKETKALLTNLHEVNITLFKRLSTQKRLPVPLPANVIPTPCSDQLSHSQEQCTKRVALEDLKGYVYTNVGRVALIF